MTSVWKSLIGTESRELLQGTSDHGSPVSPGLRRLLHRRIVGGYAGGQIRAKRVNIPTAEFRSVRR